MNIPAILVFINVVLVSIPNVTGGATPIWMYKGDQGPDYWPGVCTTGKRQSPINIERTKIQKVIDYEPLVLVNYDRAPKKIAILNNGFTAKLTFDNSETGWSAKIQGGGLPGTYQFEYLDFHWGSKLGQGSEHTLDGISYPMEMQLVHFNTKYGDSMTTALEKSRNWYDTLAFVAVWFQLRSEDNPKLEPIIKTLEFIQTDGLKFQTPLFPLMDLLPENTEHYFRYNGSMTRPTCNEVVLWTVFRESVDISIVQLKKFRQLTFGNKRVKRILDNFRPINDLNNRPVYEIDTYGVGSTGPSIAAASCLAYLVLCSLMKLLM